MFDKFLNSISHKFPKGYPDMNNEQDILLLETLINKVLGENVELNEMGILTENDNPYDDLIKSSLKVKTIPKCQTPLVVGKSFSLTGKDAKIWASLYSIKPLKSDGTPTAGSGNGEVATYWAYQHNIKPISTQDGRGGDNPDLIIGGIGVEVKAYDTSTITLGKFKSDGESVSLLNRVFGVLTLFGEEDTKANAGGFKPQDLLNSFTIISSVYNNKELRSLSVTQPFFVKMDNLYKELGLESNPTPKQATVALLRKLLWSKLIKKPNKNQEVGYILNVALNGAGEYTKITKQIIDSIPDDSFINNGVTVKSSEIQMNFNQLFKS
jgi:hypothetical protein